MTARFRGSLVLAFVLFALACSDAPKLDGFWQGADWGRVTFVDLRGSYTDTYGSAPGEIRLERAPDGSYTGTWGEGVTRHGTLRLRFESPDVIVGDWSADASSTIQGQAGGIIRWTRQP